MPGHLAGHFNCGIKHCRAQPALQPVRQGAPVRSLPPAPERSVQTRPRTRVYPSCSVFSAGRSAQTGKTLCPSPDSAAFRLCVRQRSGALACLPAVAMGFDKIPLNNIPQSSPKRKWELQFFTQFPLFFLIFPCFRAPGASSGVCPPAFPAGKQKMPAKAAAPRPPAAPFPLPDGG